MITKSDLVAVTAAKANVRQSDAKAVIDGLIEEIGLAMADGTKVQIAGLGTFERKATKARVGRNPATGASVDIPAGAKVSFKASSDLKAKL